MKAWMIDFLQRHGFLGVFLMAAWPNALFDLCGICCGHFMMPFWEFFLAVLLGKCFVKANMQAFFFITVFTPRYYTAAVHGVTGALGLDAAHWTQRVERQSQKLVAKFSETAEDGGPEPMAKVLWQWFIFLCIGYFAVTCVHALAQKEQGDRDEASIQKKLRDEKATA